jgi:hypothetical protein
MASTYRDSLGKYAILRLKTGLKSVQFKSRPARYEATPEAYARKDQNFDGNFLEDFQENVISGAIKGLAPFWNDLKDTYWVEDRRILEDIVKNGPVNIRYPNNHPDKPGQIIKPEDIDPRNYQDYFFQSEELKMKRMVSGKYTFELQKDPIDTILYYCYKNDPRVLVKDGSEVSKYVAGRAEYELIIPKQEMMQNKNVLKKEIDALSYLGSMSYEKQKHIAKIMRLRLNDVVNPDPDNLYLELGKTAKRKDRSSKWGISYQDKFISLATMPNEDLMLHLDLIKGMDLRVITKQRNEYFLNSERIEGVSDETELFNFFKDDANSERYKDLVFLIEEKEKQVA